MVGLVKVHPSAGRVATDVSIVTLQPTDLVEHNLIGDVGRVVGIVCVGRGDVNDGDVGGPLRPHLQQQVGGLRAVGQENFDIIIDLVLKRQALLGEDGADDEEQHYDGTRGGQHRCVQRLQALVEFSFESGRTTFGSLAEGVKSRRFAVHGGGTSWWLKKDSAQRTTSPRNQQAS